MNELGKAAIWATGAAALIFGSRPSSSGGLSAFDPSYAYEPGFEQALADLVRAVRNYGLARATPWRRAAAHKALNEALSEIATIIDDITDPSRRAMHFDALPPPLVPIIRKALGSGGSLNGL